MYSEKYCADGVPLWLVDKEEYESFAIPVARKMTFNETTGLPVNCYTKLPWAALYASYAVSKSFGDLYSNKNGKLDRYVLNQFFFT